MIDTIKNRSQALLFEYLIRNERGSSSDIHAFIRENEVEVSLVTVKRLLSRLKRAGLLESSGAARALTYTLSPAGKLTAHIDAHAYGSIEPDIRFGLSTYQFDLIPALIADPFSEGELTELERATARYRVAATDLTPTIHQKELERFVIELSWKSSKIEGNTYTLLDTERLIRYGEEARGHSKDEARMILNHKQAFSHIYKEQKSFKELSVRDIERIHEILTEGLSILRGLRKNQVGVLGSRYRPLDNQYQIAEAMDALTSAIARMPHGYAKALVTLIGISYIQPFEDGNKRTARLAANAVLLAHDLSPLSYRSVSEEEYREATLVFYELNSLQPFKKLFSEQYLFAADQYLVS